METVDLIAGVAWDPEIRGFLAVLTGVVVLMGSVWLLLATNTGARLGTLIASAGFFGWMVIMGAVWWIYGIGYRGDAPTWEEVEIAEGLDEVDLDLRRDGGNHESRKSRAAAHVDQRARPRVCQAIRLQRFGVVPRHQRLRGDRGRAQRRGRQQLRMALEEGQPALRLGEVGEEHRQIAPLEHLRSLLRTARRLRAEMVR